MARYIDADILIRATMSITEGTDELYSPTFFKKIIDRCDTEDVAPIIRGKWGYKGANWFCSNCNIQFCDNPEDFKYCPWCGAEMEESEEEE